MVRDEHVGTMSSSPDARSARRRARKRARSKASPSIPSGAPTNSWRMTGAVWRATRPATSGRTGTSRQARISSPASVIFSTSSHSSVWRRWSSVGRKQTATAYRPWSGSGKSATARKNRSGIWTSIPAPSPVSASAPSAPRCSMAPSAMRPRRTASWEGTPSRRATSATPQPSCSFFGS